MNVSINTFVVPNTGRQGIRGLSPKALRTRLKHKLTNTESS